MIHIKKPDDIEKMRVGGKILADTLYEVLENIKPGVTELQLDALAEKLIVKRGGEPGFKKVAGYHHTICTSVNEVVVHGIPTDNIIVAGDTVGVDCGVFYKGFHTDMSETIQVKGKGFKKTEAKIDEFLRVGKHALEEAIKVAVIGNRVGHISKTIQELVEKKAGYSVVRSLVGHGVGKKLHEQPEVPGFLRGAIEKTPTLREGMVLAIEVIYNMGEKPVVLAADGWTIETEDGSISGVFERTVAITKRGPEILT